MANSVFPECIMLCILARLPVKSIVRFKSVCKPWLELFSTPEFVKMHRFQFSGDPRNQSFIVHRTRIEDGNAIFNFNIESNEKKKLTINDHPFGSDIAVEIIGHCNGLFCINEGDSLVFWNPAMRLSKTVPFPSKVEFNVMSLGFGYDAEDDDYKVVRIVLNVNGVEMYSVNSDSWTTIEPGFQFRIIDYKMDGSANNFIVNGNPFWRAEVDDIESAEGGSDEILVCFDVKKQIFRPVPIPSLNPDEKETFVDWNGSLGALVFTMDNNGFGSLDAWVFDDGEQIWRKKDTLGSIEINIYSFLQWTTNGKIIVELGDGKFYVFDPETGRVMLLFDGDRLWKDEFFQIYGYSESLAHIKGMEKVGV